MTYFKHKNAIVESENIGKGTRVWAFAHILPGATVGSDCNVCDNVFIENEVVVGDRVTIKCGVQLWDGVTLEDDVFVGPNATFTNDLFPRSKNYPQQWARTIVKKGASIGANATILPGLTIGPHAMVGAGSVVTKDVPAYAVVAGNPATIRNYVDTRNIKLTSEVSAKGQVPLSQSKIEGVKIVELPSFSDMRGNLLVAEYKAHIPFIPKRIFLVDEVPNRQVRGEHAHMTLQQFLVCVRGSCSVMVDNGKDREEILLDSKTIGVYIPPMIWSTQYKYSFDAILMVFASEPYDSDDYVRDYQSYLKLLKK